MILNDTDKLLMVMCPYQVYAVEALVRQATLTNRNAYVWHTTGAGKTLTSFKTAQILAANPNIKKVIFLVDCKDLDSQTTEEFNKFENGSVDATDRTDVLVKQMQDKNRQLIVTTMQKMANAVKRPQYAKIMDAYKDEKVVFIIDECHRSQFGDMHKDIVRHFQKAQFFGFTGTPRFEVNGKVEGKITQITEMLFGECVHNYLIKDAIFDNNVLGFHVEYIKTMEGDFDWDDPTLADAIDVNELYLSEERMPLIANHIIQNHKAKTRNRQYTETDFGAIKTCVPPDMISKYNFTRKQQELLNTLLEQDEVLISATQSLAISDATAQDILKNLPESLSAERKKVIKAACSLVGKVNYFWGGKSSAIGWDSEWGKLKTVSSEGSKTTGTKRPFGLDCSGFVTWSFINSDFSANSIGHGTQGQIAKCSRISWSNAQAGDLAFYGDLSHVGIIAGKDASGNILVIHCSSSNNNVAITTNGGFGFAARPRCY